jgi:hypothetical protein
MATTIMIIDLCKLAIPKAIGNFRQKAVGGASTAIAGQFDRCIVSLICWEVHDTTTVVYSRGVKLVAPAVSRGTNP